MEAYSQTGPRQVLMDISGDPQGQQHRAREPSPKRRLEDGGSGRVSAEREVIARLEAEIQEREEQLNRYELAAADNELGWEHSQQVGAADRETATWHVRRLSEQTH